MRSVSRVVFGCVCLVGCVRLAPDLDFELRFVDDLKKNASWLLPPPEFVPGTVMVEFDDENSMPSRLYRRDDVEVLLLGMTHKAPLKEFDAQFAKIPPSYSCVLYEGLSFRSSSRFSLLRDKRDWIHDSLEQLRLNSDLRPKKEVTSPDEIVGQQLALKRASLPNPLLRSDLSIQQCLLRSVVVWRQSRKIPKIGSDLYVGEIKDAERKLYQSFGFSQVMQGRNLAVAADIADLISNQKSCCVVFGKSHLNAFERFLLQNGFKLVHEE